MKKLILILLTLSLVGCWNPFIRPDKIKIPDEVMVKPEPLQKL